MKRLQLFLILLVCLFASPAASQQALGFDIGYTMRFACKHTPYDCPKDFLPPRYVFYLPAEVGDVRGAYDNNVVYLNPSLRPGTDIRVTAIHETVHYLQNRIGGHPNRGFINDPATIRILCDDEAEAFGVGDRYLKLRKERDKMRGKDWWFPYEHCHQFYDPNYVLPQNEDLVFNLILGKTR